MSLSDDSDSNTHLLGRPSNPHELGRILTPHGVATAMVRTHPCIFAIYVPDWKICPYRHPTEFHTTYEDDGTALPMFRDRVAVDVYVAPNRAGVHPGTSARNVAHFCIPYESVDLFGPDGQEDPPAAAAAAPMVFTDTTQAVRRRAHVFGLHDEQQAMRDNAARFADRHAALAATAHVDAPPMTHRVRDLPMLPLRPGFADPRYMPRPVRLPAQENSLVPRDRLVWECYRVLVINCPGWHENERTWDGRTLDGHPLGSLLSLEPPLIGHVQWDRMEKLQAVFLDLRECFRGSGISRQGLEDVAQIMSTHLNLAILAIAYGEPIIPWSDEELTKQRQAEARKRRAEETGKAYHDDDDEEAAIGEDADMPPPESWEGWFREMNEDPRDWPEKRTLVRLFHGALRPGGKLILLNDLETTERPNPVVRHFGPISAIFSTRPERRRERRFRGSQNMDFWTA